MSIKERRKPTASSFSPLPADYTKMVNEVFSANFGERVKNLEGASEPRFVASGEIYSDEVVVRISLVETGKLSATTIHTSCDFDPKASSPTVEDLLAACVDAAGDLFTALFERGPDEEGNPALLSPALAALGSAPLQWTETEVAKRRIYLKVDKSNPVLDEAADDWLSKNDPDFKKRLADEEQQAESLFVVPPKKPGQGSGLH